MTRTSDDTTAQTFDDAILDQDFDEWQTGRDFDDGDHDLLARDDDFAELTTDSHFLMRELDFAGEFESL